MRPSTLDAYVALHPRLEVVHRTCIQGGRGALLFRPDMLPPYKHFYFSIMLGKVLPS